MRTWSDGNPEEKVIVAPMTHWIDWQRDHERWTFLVYLDIMGGYDSISEWYTEPSLGWTCSYGNRG